MAIFIGVTAIDAIPVLLSVILTIIYLVAFTDIKAARLLDKMSTASGVSTNFVTPQDAFVFTCPRISRRH